MKIQSTFYQETIKAIADIQPRKKITDIYEHNVMYNDVFMTTNENFITHRYLDQIMIYKYGHLKSEKEKETNGQPHNKRLVKIFNAININHNYVQDFYSIHIIGEIEQTDMMVVTSKQLYTTLLRNSYHLHTSEAFWQQFFPEYLDFQEIWASVNSPLLMEDTRSYIWEEIHLNFYNTYWFNTISNKGDACPLCKEVPQSKIHIILHCKMSKELWKNIEGTLKKYTPLEISETEMCFGIFKEKMTTEEHIRNWITYKLREAILKQERFAYDKPGIDNKLQIKNRFNKDVRKELIYRYHLAKKDHKSDQFLATFNCKIELIKIIDGKFITQMLI